MDPRWGHPFTCLIAGPTGSGKTHFTGQFIDKLPGLVQPPVPTRIVWLYGQWQDYYTRLRSRVEFYSGLDFLNDLLDSSPTETPPTLVIVDDLMEEADGRLCRLFTKGSHHLNVSVIYLVQNLFHNANKDHRTISLNAQYVVLFKNPRDGRQIEYIANQMFPGRSRLLRQAFEDATGTRPYSYLLLDMKQTTPDQFRVRTNIFRKAEGLVGDEVYLFPKRKV